jgi:hypothetical protein
MASDYTNPFAGQTNPYLNSANPYLKGQIDSASNAVLRNYNLSTQPAYNTAMVKSGSFGNEGVQQMNENAQKNMQGTLGDLANNMYMQDYNNQQNLYMQDRAQNIGNYQWDQGFNRSLYNDAYSQNMNNLTTGVGLLGTLAGYNSNDLTNANNIQNTPLNYWSNFSNQANGMGQGYGSTTGTVGSTSSPWTSALGGAQLGSSAMGWWNNYNNQNNAATNGTATNTGTQYLPSGYDALGFPNNQ